jgi:hypothetical protein
MRLDMEIIYMLLIPILICVIYCIVIFRKYKNIKDNGIIVCGKITDFRWNPVRNLMKLVSLKVEYKYEGEIYQASSDMFTSKIPKINENLNFIFLSYDKSILYSAKFGDNIDYFTAVILALFAGIFTVLIFLPALLIVVFS